MHWTIAPCARSGDRARGRARHQRDDRERARPARLRRPASGAGLPRRRAAAHDPFAARRHASGLRDDPRGDRGRQADLRARRLRRRRHLRDRARRARRSASSAPTSTGTCRAASTRATAVAETLDAARRRGLRPRPHRRLRHHRGRGGGAAPARAGSRWSSPTTTGRRRAAGLPDRRHPAVRLPVPRALRHRRRATSSARRCSAWSEASRRHLDLVALATIADVVPLVDENRALARGRPARARAHDEARAARAHASRRASTRRRSTPARSASGSRPRINAAGRLGQPRAALELLLTDGRRGGASGSPAELEALNRERQGVEDRILREAIAEVESWPEARRRAPRLRARGRGVARGRDRDRRLAARRALPPAGRADRRRRRRCGRARAARSAPSTCTARSPPAPATSSAAAATAPRPGSRSAPSAIEAFATAFAAHADSALADDDLRPTLAVDAVVRGRELTLEPLRGAAAAARRSGSATRP